MTSLSSRSGRGLAASGAAGLALALVAVGGVTARFALDRGAANESLSLALWAALVLFPVFYVAASVTTGSRVAEWTVSAAGLGTALVILFLPRTDGSRSAAVAALILLALAAAARGSLHERPRSNVAVAALAFAVGLVAHGHRLFGEPRALSTWLLLALLPAVATGLAGALDRRGWPRAAWLAAGLVLFTPLLVRETWWTLATAAALVALALAPHAAVARLARGGLAAMALLTLLAGSFPWLRAAPLSAALGAILAVPERVETVHERAAVLTAAAPRLEIALSGGTLDGLLLDSYLTHSTALPCGTPLASLRLDTRNGASESRLQSALLLGRDSAEWAAERPDVALALACAPPPAFVHWIPGSGRFLGRTTRARIALPAAVEASRLVIERDAALPADLSIAIFHLAVER